VARRVDPQLTKQALNALRRAADKAKASEEGLSEWEEGFLHSVTERLNTYGSAFSDPDKGQTSAPLSLRQGLKVRQISKKGEKPKPKEPKPKKPLARKTALTRKPFPAKRPKDG
jgi:TorA maturation chaperone TorD